MCDNKLWAGGRHDMPPPPASWQYLRIYSPGGTCSGMLAIWDISNKLTFDLLTMKVVSESRVMWATSVRQTDKTSDRRQTKASLNASALWRRRHNNECDVLFHNICTSEMIVTDNYNLCSVRTIFIIQPSMF